MIRFFGIEKQYLNLKEEILNCTDKVLSTGKVLDGEYVENFESAIAKRCNRKYAIAVNSGTQALIFVQNWLSRSHHIKVLIPSISFVATLNSVLMSGNSAKFCDVDFQGLMNLQGFDQSLSSEKIDAIMYVNLFGNIVDYGKQVMISKFFNKDISIIEDAAQSFGGSYENKPSGSLGDYSILSFDPTKNLSNFGSGGMILTDSHSAMLYFRNIQNNGKFSEHSVPGTNSKMSEVDCAHMLIKLNHFDNWQTRRTKIAEYYNQEFHSLKPFGLLTLPQTPNTKHAWHKYVVRCSSRNELIEHLSSKNIETKIHYSTPLFEYDIGWPFINYATELYREARRFRGRSSLPRCRRGTGRPRHDRRQRQG